MVKRRRMGTLFYLISSARVSHSEIILYQISVIRIEKIMSDLTPEGNSIHNAYSWLPETTCHPEKNQWEEMDLIRDDYNERKRILFRQTTPGTKGYGVSIMSPGIPS